MAVSVTSRWMSAVRGIAVFSVVVFSALSDTGSTTGSESKSEALVAPQAVAAAVSIAGVPAASQLRGLRWRGLSQRYAAAAVPVGVRSIFRDTIPSFVMACACSKASALAAFKGRRSADESELAPTFGY